MVQTLQAKFALKVSPFRILLFASSIQEGCEDLATLFYYYHFFKQQFAAEKMGELQGLIFVSLDKLALFKRTYASLLPPDFYEHQEGEILDQKKVADSSFIIWTGYRSDPDYGEEAEALKTYLARSKVLINFAHPLSSQAVLKRIVNDAKSGSAIFSVAEYGALGMINNFEGQLQKIYDEIALGLEEKEAGIEFHPEIAKNAALTLQEKTALLATLQHKPLLAELLKDEKTESAYLKNVSLFYSSLSSKAGTENFILLAAAASLHDKLDLFIPAHFIKNYEAALISEKLLQQLKKFAVARIELLDAQQKTLKTFTLTEKEEEELSLRKKLRLISHDEVGHDDHLILLVLAAGMTVSGDAAITQALSGGVFPYFYLSDWKVKICETMIKYLKNTPKRPEELIRYLTLSVQKPREALKEALYTKEHYAKIVVQWQAYCEEVKTLKSNLPAKVDLLDRIYLYLAFNEASEEELKALLKLKPQWLAGETNFVFLAVLARRPALLKLLYESDQKLFNKMINDFHPSIKVTPFLLATLNQDLEMTRAFLDFEKLNTKLTNPEGLNVLHLALCNNDLPQLKFFLTLAQDAKLATKETSLSLINLKPDESWLRVAIQHDAHACLAYLLPFFNEKITQVLPIFQYALAQSKLDGIEAMLPQLQSFPLSPALEGLYLSLIDNGFGFIDNPQEQLKPLADFITPDLAATAFVKEAYQAAFKPSNSGFGLVDYFMSAAGLKADETDLLSRLAVLALLATKSKDPSYFTQTPLYLKAAQSKKSQLKKYLSTLKSYLAAYKL